MDGAHNNQHYETGDTVKLEIVLHYRANLREVRVIFEHTHDKSVAPLIARGRPYPISESVRWLDQEPLGRRNYAASGSHSRCLRTHSHQL